DIEQCRIKDYNRELCLKTAVLKRSFTWLTKSGRVLRVVFERFASAARPHLFVQKVSVDCTEPTALTIVAGIDADVRTSGYDHFRSVELDRAGENGITCAVRTDGEDTVTMQTELRPIGMRWSLRKADRRAELAGGVEIPAGERFVLEKRTAVTTSRDLDSVGCRDVLEATSALGYDELCEEHTRIWSARWDQSDVVIDGDDESQLAMRCAIYHLLRAHVPGDDRVAIDAKGYAGDAYFGRFFWDTEMYLLPFYLYTAPERARSLVGFRIRTLPGARQTAANYGYPGAKYPWVADRDGRDSCPNWQYADHEVHVTADVVYAMAHYAAAADDPDFLNMDAAEVIVETARYWMARIDWRSGDGYPSLLGVMGPDEYTPISNNNSYTNR
ncbi:MAG: glycoside hydrolase family 65 protein, partial [Armatimonadota bacterium]